jgi:hypothetical protein
MSFVYQTGERIHKGDHVEFHREPGSIELVADPNMPDPETEWYVKEYGGGVMVKELNPKVFGRVFLTEPDDAEDLVFVSRAVS